MIERFVLERLGMRRLVGPGNALSHAGELFKAMAGIDVVHVPHKGSAEARTSVLAGDVQMMFDAITTMAPLAQAGKVRAIATRARRALRSRRACRL